MATVYLAEDPKHRRKVGVKVLRAELAAALGPERFLREIEISAGLHHPHILPLYDSHIVLTKEVLVLKVAKNDEGIDPFLLLALFSLKVVQDQYTNLALMQINRDHLGDHWREVLIPMPTTQEARRTISHPIREYFQGIVQARLSYDQLLKTFGPETFGTRP